MIDSEFIENSSSNSIIYIESTSKSQGLRNVYFSMCVSEKNIIEFIRPPFNFVSGKLYNLNQIIFENTYAENMISCSGADVEFKNVEVL